MSKIIIVDDDFHLRQSFEKLLTEEGHEVFTASTGEAGIALAKEQVPDLIIMDVRLPGMDGLEAYQTIREIEPKIPVIIMTAFGTTETAIEATKLGAFDYVLKPFEILEMLNLIEQALEVGRFIRSKVEIDGFPDTEAPDAIVGRHDSMQELYKAIGRVASTDATVLVRGESGTGKELVARALYQHSLRADKPFLVINCVAIPETLLESELFGYEKGAFTGAVSRRIGKIEQAHKGTVFLDEIGDMPLSIQAKILRLLQEKSIERLGGRDPISADVRIIAATNRDLEAGLAEGRFREDLYYRLKVVTLWLPPLRERWSDVPLLAEYFVSRFAKGMNIDNPGISNEVKKIFLTYRWPGNVRELANTIQKALIFNRGGPIRPEDISQAIQGEGFRKDGDDQSADATIRQWMRKALVSNLSENMFDSCMDHFANILISEALRITGGNRTRAAKLLGLSRPTLQSKIEKYHIKIVASVKTA